MASAWHLAAAPHTSHSTLSAAANVHLLCALGNGLVHEADEAPVNPFRTHLARSPLEVRDGHTEPNDAPELGLEIDQNPRAARKFTVESSLQSGFRNVTFEAAAGCALHEFGKSRAASDRSRRSEAQPRQAMLEECPAVPGPCYLPGRWPQSCMKAEPLPGGRPRRAP